MHDFRSSPFKFSALKYFQRRLENAVDVSKEKYLLNSNSVLINELDRVILNCLQATRNMESFLAKTPLESNDVPTSAIIQTTHNVGEGSTAETRFRIDPALTATVEHLVYSEAINDLTTVEGDAMDAGVEIMYDDAATKEAATDKGAIKRLHIARIYPQKKLELLKNQLEREELLKSTPEYVDYTKSQKELLNFFEEIGLNKAEKDVKSVQKASHFLCIYIQYPSPKHYSIYQICDDHHRMSSMTDDTFNYCYCCYRGLVKVGTQGDGPLKTRLILSSQITFYLV